MQSVRKSSLCLEEDEAEPDFPGNESPQLINEHSFVSEQRPVAISERVQAGSESEQAAEPQVHVTQQCQAFEVRGPARGTLPFV